MRARFVVDASVTMAWCFENEGGELALLALNALADGEALVPAIWTLEVANVLLVAERRGRLMQADSEQFLALLAKLPIAIDTTGTGAISEQILGLGREYGLSSYDAAYLELAMREGLQLATGDTKLLHTMKALGVPPFDGGTAVSLHTE